MDPLSDALARLGTGDPRPAVALLQCDMHDALERFLNNPYPRLGQLAWPLARGGRTIDPFVRARALADALGASGLVPRTRDALAKPPRDRRALARTLAAWCSELPELDGILRPGPSAASRGHMTPWRAPGGLDRYLAKLETQARRMLPDVADVLVHGSFGSNDAKLDWSDLDTLIVVKAEAARDPDALMRIADATPPILATAQAILPFQPHGVFAVTEQDLACYPQPFLPTPIIPLARSLCGAPEIGFALRDAREEAIRVFHRDNIERSRRLREAASARGGIDTDLAFVLLHMIYLFPAELLIALGHATTKRASFDEMRKVLSPEDARVIDDASEIYHAWSTRYVRARSLAYAAARVNPYIAGPLLRRAYRRRDLFGEYATDLDALAARFDDVAQRAWERVRTEAPA